jgi:Tol biopolymer transport system component/predicted Ser/Thr protein kinase
VEDERGRLEGLLEAVLDGEAVDWASAESSADAPEQEAVRQLKVLAGIAELHRTLSPDAADPAAPAGPEGKLGRWGRLELLERIGRGAFGEVFRAWDSKLDREVAVKLLHASGQREGATVLREARLLARVRHPNVVTVYDADESDGRVGLWMEFIEGRNLEQILKESRTFGEKEVARIGIELCRALAAVHAAGLLHRDIKTQNLMQTDDGRLVLMDFGTGRESEETHVPSADAAGTPLYLAPEVFRGDQATVRSDIYSAGVVLYHLLTRAYPVRGSTVREVGAAHARGQRLDLAARAPAVSKALAAVIGRAIETDPAKRFESARQMLDALESIERRRTERKAKRSWLALGAITVVVIALAAVAGWMRRDPGGDSKSKAGGATYFGSTPEKRAVQVPRAMSTGVPSPDGRYLPYSEEGTGNLALYEFATGQSRVLTSGGDGGNENWATMSIVSEDSGQVAYQWADGPCDCLQLRIIDSDGKNDRLLFGGRDIPYIDPLEWSADGSRILGRRQKGAEETDVVLVSVSDGSVQPIRTFEHGPGMIRLSPDGHFIAYDRAEDPEDKDHGIYLAPTDGGEEVPLVTGPAYDSHPMWTADGSGLVFASNRTGGPDLWLQPVKDGRADGKPRLLDKDMGPFAPITLTRQDSLFYDHRTGLMDVYTAPIDPATGNVTGEPANVAARFLGSNLETDWSPDGRMLVFASWRTMFGPGRNILVFHSMETGLERDFELDVDVVNGPNWSPDGRLIAVGGAGAIRLIDVESGKIVSTLLKQKGDYPPATGFAWSVDGLNAYLRRNPGTITRLDTSNGEEELLYEPPPDSVLNGISLSPDGQSLAFAIYDRPTKTARLLVMPSGGGSPRTLFEKADPGAFGVGGWTRDGQRIFYVIRTYDSEGKQYGELWVAPVEGGLPHAAGLRMRALRGVRVSPDGTRIAFTSGFPERGLWVFENFLPSPLTK